MIDLDCIFIRKKLRELPAQYGNPAYSEQGFGKCVRTQRGCAGVLIQGVAGKWESAPPG